MAAVTASVVVVVGRSLPTAPAIAINRWVGELRLADMLAAHCTLMNDDPVDGPHAEISVRCRTVTAAVTTSLVPESSQRSASLNVIRPGWPRKCWIRWTGSTTVWRTSRKRRDSCPRLLGRRLDVGRLVKHQLYPNPHHRWVQRPRPRGASNFRSS